MRSHTLAPDVALELLDEPYAKRQDVRERAYRQLLREFAKRLSDDEMQGVVESLLSEAGRVVRSPRMIENGVATVAAGLAVDLFGESEDGE